MAASADKATSRASQGRGPAESETAGVGHLAMVVVMMAGAFLSALNQNLMNTALPTYMSVFGVTAGDVQWLITGYTLANGVMIPVTAYLVGRFSTRRMYFWAMGLFAAGTVLCAAAPVFGVLLAGRVVQALGAGISMTLMQTVLFTVFPPDRRGTAMGFFGLVIAFAPAFGPVVAGLIIDALPWQALFLVQLPPLAVLLLLAAFLVKNVTGGQGGSLDALSVVLSTLGFGGVLYGFGTAGSLGFASPVVLGSMAVGMLGIVLFVRRQLRLDVPVLEFRVFGHRGFTSALAMSVGAWSLFIGTAAVLPLFMQDMLGFSATESGLTLMGGGIAYGVLSPVTGRLFDRFGPRVIVPVGFALMCMGQAAFALAGGGAQMAYLAGFYAVFLVGLALCSMPLTTLAINTLPQRLIAHGTAMNNTMRQVLSAIATAVFVSTMALVAGPGAEGAAQVPGVIAVFATEAALAAVMFAASLVLFRKPPGRE